MKAREWPLLAVGAALLLAGAASAWTQQGNAPLSYALGAAGLVCLGVWLTTEVIRFTGDRMKRKGDTDG